MTLDKMVNETERVGKRNIVHTIKTPSDITELKEQLAALNKTNYGYVMVEHKKKETFFGWVRTFFTGKSK